MTSYYNYKFILLIGVLAITLKFTETVQAQDKLEDRVIAVIDAFHKSLSLPAPLASAETLDIKACC